MSSPPHTQHWMLSKVNWNIKWTCMHYTKHIMELKKAKAWFKMLSNFRSEHDSSIRHILKGWAELSIMPEVFLSQCAAWIKSLCLQYAHICTNTCYAHTLISRYDITTGGHYRWNPLPRKPTVTHLSNVSNFKCSQCDTAAQAGLWLYRKKQSVIWFDMHRIIKAGSKEMGFHS